ncbi:MAG: hypothetical protein ACLQDF_11490 [Desulfomonilia bacterium]
MAYLLYLHIFFMAIAVFLVISAFTIVRKKKTGWFARHRKMALLAVLSALLGFIAEFIFKTALHYPHLKSPHAFAGVISLMLLIITPATGLLIASDPKRYRAIHKTLGKITSVAVPVTAFMGIARFIQLSRR